MLFLFTGKFFVGQDGTMCRNTVCGGCRRALHATGGGLGVLPQEICKFCKYKLWEGHFCAISRAPGKKRLKKAFHRNWEKKVFAPKKRLRWLVPAIFHWQVFSKFLHGVWVCYDIAKITIKIGGHLINFFTRVNWSAMQLCKNKGLNPPNSGLYFFFIMLLKWYPFPNSDLGKFEYTLYTYMYTN